MLSHQHALVRQVQVWSLGDTLLVNDGICCKSIETGRVKPGIPVRSQHTGS